MEVVRRAEEVVRKAMHGRDASHDAAHAFRVRDLALSLAGEEGLSSTDSLQIVSIHVFPPLLALIGCSFAAVSVLLVWW